jgi:hypothetical protein
MNGLGEDTVGIGEEAVGGFRPGEQQHRQGGAGGVGFQSPADFAAAHARQVGLDEQQLWPFNGKAQGLGGVGGVPDDIADFLQHLADRVGVGFLIVHDEEEG